ncbi:L,D-transpeptidase family protein [Neisseria sp. Ec49-e6-T10]|uniref:L,D-transpeptidase family protein n=1 Tax=Neisseria sp. Ec49-e6-T10 TaxID=3140744 RepID=UPI003EB7AEF4
MKIFNILLTFLVLVGFLMKPVFAQTASEPTTMEEMMAIIHTDDDRGSPEQNSTVIEPQETIDTIESEEEPKQQHESQPESQSIKPILQEETILQTEEPKKVEESTIVVPSVDTQPMSNCQQKALCVANLLSQQMLSPDFAQTHANPYTANAPWLVVGAQSQSMKYYDAWGRLVKTYPVSTAKNGVGEVENTYQTPRGHHKICEKIGEGVESRTIFSRRQATQWKYSEQLHKENPKKDWILTRIMWLCGQEEGKNKGYNQYGQVVDSYKRYIYIHGAGDHAPFGVAPSSLGCVRMVSEDVIELFNESNLGMDVLIKEFE